MGYSTNQRSFSRGTWHSFAASPTDVPPPRSVLWPSTAAPRRFPAPLRKLRNFGPQLGMTRAEKCMDFMEKMKVSDSFTNKPLVDE